LQESAKLQDAFSKLVSGGKSGYKSIIEKKEPVFCSNENCKIQIEGHEKFCPSCGGKIEKKSTMSICKKCYNVIKSGDKFCTECGEQAK